MRTKTRILSALLTVFLLLSVLATGVAAETAMPGKVLYEEDFTSLMEKLGWKQDTRGYTGSSYALSIADDWGAAGNKALKLTETADGWCGIEIVPEEKMTDVTKYSISADMMWETAKAFSFRFGDASASNGDFVGISWDYLLWNTMGGNNEADTNYRNTDVICKNKTVRVVANVDAEAGTISVSVDGTVVTSRDNATKQTGAIYLVVRSLTAYLDNIEVKNTETGTIIYAEDFETVQDIYTANDAEYEYNGNGTDTTTVVPKNGVLRIDRPNDSYSEWGNLREIMPASAVNGIDKYVIAFDLKVIQASGSWTHGVFFGWGAGGNDNRNLVQFASASSGDVINGVKPIGNELYHSDYQSSVNRNLRIQIEVDAGAKTSTLWVDGKQYGTITNANFTNGGFSIGAAYHTTAAVDNLLVTAGTVADLAQVRGVGVQQSAVADGKYAVRFVGALSDDVALEDYIEVGFKLTATYGEDGQKKILDTACTTVYTKITGSEGGVTTEYSAADFGAKYLFALAVNGIPTDIGTVTFTVTPYFVTADGTVNGSTCTVVYNAGNLVDQNAN